MAGNDDAKPLSPTVSKVLDKFVEALTADDTIDQGVVDRLNQLLRTGKVPKPEEIAAAAFAPLAVLDEDSSG